MPPEFKQPTPQPSQNQGDFPPKFTPPPSPSPTKMDNQVPPPKIPTIQMKPSGNEHKKIFSVVLIAIVLVIVLSGIYYFKRSGTVTQKFSSENVKVRDNKNQVPSGFPKDLKIEGVITQSSTQEYVDRKATLYSLSYDSTVQAEELYARYGEYLKTNKYQIVNQSKSSSLMTYDANNGENSLSVVITPLKNSAKVVVSYFVRK